LHGSGFLSVDLPCSVDYLGGYSRIELAEREGFEPSIELLDPITV
jgi:hypothetical protein